MAAFTADSKTVVIGDANGALHEWSSEQNTETTALTPGAITGIIFAPDGKALVTTHQAAAGSAVVILDVARRILETKSGFVSVAFSRDGAVLALGGTHIELLNPVSQKQVRVIELPEMSLRESNRLFENRPNADTRVPISVTALAFAPDGRTLASGCRDGTVRLVNVNGSK